MKLVDTLAVYYCNIDILSNFSIKFHTIEFLTWSSNLVYNFMFIYVLEKFGFEQNVSKSTIRYIFSSATEHTKSNSVGT